MQDTDVFGPETGKDHVKKVLEVNETLALKKTGHRFSRMNQKPCEKIGNTKSLVAAPALQGFTWTGRNNSAGDAQSLNAGLFIRADENFPALRQCLGLLVKIEYDGGSFQKQRGGRLLPRAVLPRLDFILAQPLTYG